MFFKNVFENLKKAKGEEKMKREVTVKNVKGSYDYSPEEQSIRNHIQDVLRKIFEEYGYMPLETSIL